MWKVRFSITVISIMLVMKVTLDANMNAEATANRNPLERMRQLTTADEHDWAAIFTSFPVEKRSN
jgi:hypothetical protein